MSYIDSAVLNLTETFCRWFQRMTGRTNVWLAVQLTNLSIILYFVWAGAYLLRGEWPVRIALGTFCAGLLYVLSQTVLRVPVEASEQNAYRRVSRGLRNPRRVRDAMLRVVFLTLALLLGWPTWFLYTALGLTLPLLTYSLIVLTTLLLYVLACDPLPPRTGKVVEWVRGRAPARPAAGEQPAVRTIR